MGSGRVDRLGVVVAVRGELLADRAHHAAMAVTVGALLVFVTVAVRVAIIVVVVVVVVVVVGRGRCRGRGA